MENIRSHKKGNKRSPEKTFFWGDFSLYMQFLLGTIFNQKQNREKIDNNPTE